MKKWQWIVLAALIITISWAFTACSGCDDDDDDDNNDDEDDDTDDDSDDDLDDDVDDDSDDDFDDDLNDDIDDDIDDDVDDDVDDDDDDILVNHGDGTASDPNTGLMWQISDNGEEVGQPAAVNYCVGLVIESYDDWRLPTLSELRSLIRGCDATVTGGECPTVDGCMDWDCWDAICEGCNIDGGPSVEGCYLPDQLEGDCQVSYWTSSMLTGGNSAWHIWFVKGGIFSAVTTDTYYARCVRL